MNKQDVMIIVDSNSPSSMERGLKWAKRYCNELKETLHEEISGALSRGELKRRKHRLEVGRRKQSLKRKTAFENKTKKFRPNKGVFDASSYIDLENIESD